MKKKDKAALNVLANIEKNTRATLPDAIKLNLGSGDYPIDGYENIDRKTGQEVYPLAMPDACAEEIRASHVLEHFSHRKVEDVLREWVRVLKPGGILKIAVPDFDLICQWHAAGQIEHAEHYLMGGHVDDNDHHGTAFTKQFLCELFCALGLEDVREWASDNADCSSLSISLNLQARKPVAVDVKADGLHWIIPSARYGPSIFHKSVYDAMNEIGGEVHMTGGCFWNQHLCPAMEGAANHPGCKYVLTFDYDSVFTVEDIRTLYAIMETHPHIDALSPLQSHRGMDTPLFSTIEQKGIIPRSWLDQLAFPAATTHFGLTMIRPNKLRAFPHPWMVGVPDGTGRWGADRVDPDIYFWRRWREEGNTIYVSPRVSIGHVDEMILWPSAKDLTPIYQKSSDYLRYGKPLEAK